MKFYRCSTCKNVLHYIKEEHVPVMCCGEVMKELTPNTVDASHEKHVPVINKNGNNVTVEIGSAPHPMLDVHYIEWIVLETNKGYLVKYLNPGDEPKAHFTLQDDENVVAAYEHCNLHGLWKK